MNKFREMKIAKRTTRHSHFYRCVKCGQLLDKRELRDVDIPRDRPQAKSENP